MGQLSAPFPYYGGKARQADAVWRELGDVTVYAEPFAGSLAVLLASEPHRREIVCDTDGHIVNFWRALRNDPAGVALLVDYPTFHQDLRARHLWLRRWGKENDDRLSEDPEWFDSRAAGWWVWGISSWIGGGWCQAVGDRTDKRPLAKPKDGGQGVQVQRENLPVDKRPLVHANGGRPGVQVQRTGLPDSIPRVTPGPVGMAFRRSGRACRQTGIRWPHPRVVAAASRPSAPACRGTSARRWIREGLAVAEFKPSASAPKTSATTWHWRSGRGSGSATGSIIWPNGWPAWWCSTARGSRQSPQPS